MNGAMLLEHVAGVIEHRGRIYGAPETLFAHIAARWSLVLGIEVTPAQVALCLIDLKLARLCRDPAHLDSAVDVAGYAAILREGWGGRPVRLEQAQGILVAALGVLAGWYGYGRPRLIAFCETVTWTVQAARGLTSAFTRSASVAFAVARS
jgi:hypothetical protein